MKICYLPRYIYQGPGLRSTSSSRVMRDVILDVYSSNPLLFEVSHGSIVLLQSTSFLVAFTSPTSITRGNISTSATGSSVMIRVVHLTITAVATILDRKVRGRSRLSTNVTLHGIRMRALMWMSNSGVLENPPGRIL